MERIVYLERESIIADVRRPACAHEWIEHAKTLPAEVEARLAGATIAIVNKVQLDAALIALLPALRMVAVAATGTNNVDLDACRVRGIVVSNIRGYAVHTVPEHAIALTLALSRNLVAYRESVQAGRWQKSEQFCFFDHPIRDLHGATLALVGSGTLGDGVARLAEAFGMRVLRAERKGAATCRAGYVPFAEALAAADVVSLHCPLTPETQGLIGDVELRAMKSSALLINTARGGLVDETALVRALREGWIAGAALDVLHEEPPPPDHSFWRLPNLVLTPHIAGISPRYEDRAAELFAENLGRYVAGAPLLNVVERERGY